MPIFAYFSVVGAALVALLFVADAKLDKQGPLAIGSQVVELPGAYRPNRMGSSLVTEAAPAPDMDSAAVRAAAPPVQVAAQESLPAADASKPAEQMAKADIKPAKKKHIARRQQPPPDSDDARHYAFRGYDNGPFGGGGQMFGRF
jgi:hypothetical protein